jgi:membrane protease YdiL (CAAX protease family)
LSTPLGLRRRVVLAIVLASGLVAHVAGAVAFVLAAIVATVVDPSARAGDFMAAAMRIEVMGPSVVGVQVVLFGMALAVPTLAKKPVRDVLGLHRAHPVAFGAAGIGTLALGPTSDLLIRGMQDVAPWATWGAIDGINALVENTSVLLLWPILALLPGVCEELCFRGLLQRALHPSKLAVIVSGAAFAGFHIDPHHVVGVLPLGFYFAWVAHVTRSTWVTVFAHVLNNSAAVILPKVLDGGIASGDTPTPAWLCPAGLALALGAAVVVARVSRPR